MTMLDQRCDAVRHAGSDAEEIHGHENRGRLSIRLERQRLCMQRQRNPLRRLGPGGKPGHPQRAIGRDVNRGDTCTPRLGRVR